MTRRTPAGAKKLTGTYRKDRDRGYGQAPPAPAPSRLWPAPESLDERGRRIWRRVGTSLLKAGLLTELDRDGFTTLVEQLTMLARIQEELRTADLLVDGKINPLLVEFRQLSEVCRKRQAEFGLNPSTRAGSLSLVLAGQKREEPDALDLLLRDRWGDDAEDGRQSQALQQGARAGQGRRQMAGEQTEV